MGKVRQAERRFIRFNVPERHGFPAIADNENLPGLGRPGERALRIRIPAPAQAVDKSAAVFAGWMAEEADHGRRLLVAPVLIGIGSVCWFSSPFGISAFVIAAMVLAAFLAALWFRTRQRQLAHGFAALALLCVGGLFAAFETERAATTLLDMPVTTVIHGQVEAVEAAGEGRWRYLVTLTATDRRQLALMPEQVSLLARSHGQPLALGEGITGRARLSPPSGPALPGLNDFGFSAYFSGIGANGHFYGAPQREHTAGEPGLWLKGRLLIADWRARIGNRIRSGIGGDAGAFAAALVTNEQRAISGPTIEALRQSGLAHIIAISGMNMVLAAGLFFVGLRAAFSLLPEVAQRFPVKKWAAAGAILGISAYYMISGFAVSAERAYLMTLIMLAAVLIDRPAISLRNVALSAILILAISPSQILGPGFQMSYAGTIGLVAGYELWARWQKRASSRRVFPLPGWLETILGYGAGVVMTSLIGGASTLLFSAEHFQRLPAYGLVANILSAPILSFVVMPAGMLALLLMPFGLEFGPLKVMGYGLDIVISIGKMVAGWGGELLTGPLSPGVTGALTLSLLLLAISRSRLRLAGLILSALFAACLFLPGPGRPDLVISEDGTLAAFVGQKSLSPSSDRPSIFLFDQWQRALERRQTDPPQYLKPTPDLRRDSADDRYRPLSDDEEVRERAFLQSAADAIAPGHFACKRHDWCLGKHRSGSLILIVENGIYAGTGCDVADIVVARTGPSFQACRSGALLISREMLRRTGALALTFSNGQRLPEIRSAFHGEDRPWTAFRHYDWRSDSLKSEIPEQLAALIKDWRRKPDQ